MCTIPVRQPAATDAIDRAASRSPPILPMSLYGHWYCPHRQPSRIMQMSPESRARGRMMRTRTRQHHPTATAPCRDPRADSAAQRSQTNLKHWRWIDRLQRRIWHWWHWLMMTQQMCWMTTRVDWHLRRMRRQTQVPRGWRHRSECARAVIRSHPVQNHTQCKGNAIEKRSKQTRVWSHILNRTGVIDKNSGQLIANTFEL